jgi:CheY-like chemotaxis protein
MLAGRSAGSQTNKPPAISCGVLMLGLASALNLFAAVPVDIFQDMESGHDGDLLTAAIMNASSHGGTISCLLDDRVEDVCDALPSWLAPSRLGFLVAKHCKPTSNGFGSASKPGAWQAGRSGLYRILVADEDSGLRQLYAEAMAGLGYYIDAAQDGAAAWEAPRDNRYHILITEHEMPNLTGVELVKMRRS